MPPSLQFVRVVGAAIAATRARPNIAPMTPGRPEASRAGASSAPDLSKPGAGGARVLIVEDEGIVALDLRERLTGLGYEVVAVESRAEGAVRKAAELRPDVILMDVRLKGEADGVEAALEIRRRQDTPIVYLTAFADPATVRKVMADSPSAYLLKPVHERELEVALHAALLHGRTASLPSAWPTAWPSRPHCRRASPQARS